MSIFGVISSIIYVNMPTVTDLPEIVTYWINFGLHIILVITWIIAECCICNENHKAHSNAVLAFGIFYIFLFLLDIATGIIMIVFGAWFITAGVVN